MMIDYKYHYMIIGKKINYELEFSFFQIMCWPDPDDKY